MPQAIVVYAFAAALLPPLSAGAQPPIEYSRSNGGPGFSSSEKLTLKPDGSVTYQLSGPVDFGWTVQNRTGEFATRAAAGTYEQLSRELTAGMALGPHETTFPPDSGIEVLGFANNGPFLRRMTGRPSPVFDTLAREVASLAATTLPHPVHALELSCRAQPQTLLCRIQSVGAAPASAPDLSSAGFFCHDRERHMLSIARPAGLPDRDAPRPDLASGQAVELRFPPAACGFHLVIDALGAVLVSNELEP